MKEFNYNETLETIKKYAEDSFREMTSKEREIADKKLFYHFNEWSGWRFYLKAIKHRDWRSIKGHIKDNMKGFIIKE